MLSAQIPTINDLKSQKLVRFALSAVQILDEVPPRHGLLHQRKCGRTLLGLFRCLSEFTAVFIDASDRYWQLFSSLVWLLDTCGTGQFRSNILYLKSCDYKWRHAEPVHENNIFVTQARLGDHAFHVKYKALHKVYS